MPEPTPEARVGKPFPWPIVAVIAVIIVLGVIAYFIWR